MSFIPGVNAPPGSRAGWTPLGICIVTPEGRMLGTNPNEAAIVNPGGSQEALVWDGASGDMVPMSMGKPGREGRGRSGGHRGGRGHFGGGMGGGMDNIVQIMPGGGGMEGMAGGTLTINGVTYPPSGGGYGGGHRGGHRGAHGRQQGGHGGHVPAYGAPPIQITYPGGGWGVGYRGGHGGDWGIGQLPPGVWARPANPNAFAGQWGPNGRHPGGGHHPQSGHHNPDSRDAAAASHLTGSTHKATIPKKLRDAPERVRKEDVAPDGKDCSICYRAFFSEEDGKLEIPVKLRTCPHIFGEGCINEWVQTSNKCPTCRGEFPILIWMEGQWVVSEPPREH